MVKPKKLSFPCVYCGKEFRKKMSLERHLLSHPGYASSSRLPRVRSNWCPVCKRSFSESEYKYHMENEHTFDKYSTPFGLFHHKDNGDITNDLSENDLNMDENFFTGEKISSATTPRGVDKISPTKVGKKRGRKPGKTVQTPSYNIHMKIKTEPPDSYERNKSTLENKKVASNSSSVLICKLCGFKSKNPRGIKIHSSTMHNKKCEKGYKPKKSPYIHKIQNTPASIKQEPQDKDSNQDNNPTKASSNSQPLFVPKIDQITVTGAVYNNLQELPFKKVIFIVNAPNEQYPSTVGNQNPQVPKFEDQNLYNMQNSPTARNQNPQAPTFEDQNPFNVANSSTARNQNPQAPKFDDQSLFNVQNTSAAGNQNLQVPKFDCNSEKYIKWIKNFIGRCKTHGYPLTLIMCQTLSHINEEITDFLTNIESSLVNRSNHFYFAKIRGTINEIMMGQLKNSMDAVTK